MEDSHVNILASRRNGTLYVGSTSNLVQRIWEHKNKVLPGFTAKCNVYLLVYYEAHQELMEAARCEKRLKNWYRQWKITL